MRIIHARSFTIVQCDWLNGIRHASRWRLCCEFKYSATFIKCAHVIDIQYQLKPADLHTADSIHSSHTHTYIEIISQLHNFKCEYFDLSFTFLERKKIFIFSFFLYETVQIYLLGIAYTERNKNKHQRNEVKRVVHIAVHDFSRDNTLERRIHYVGKDRKNKIALTLLVHLRASWSCSCIPTSCRMQPKSIHNVGCWQTLANINGMRTWPSSPLKYGVPTIERFLFLFFFCLFL